MARRRFILKLAAMAALALAAAAPSGAAEDRLPIFDTHVHYSEETWSRYDPKAVIEILRAANVVRALVSSTPDEGTLALHRADARLFVPILRPYREGVAHFEWFRHPETPAYLAERLERGIYRGIGEFHLFESENARTPQMREVVALALERDLVLHIHTGDGPVRALFAIEPGLKILWAHAGMSAPPELIGELLERYPRLMAELSFRAADIAPDGRLDPAWRALIEHHSDRLMIGSDTYVNERWETYGGLIDEHRAWLALLPRATAEAIAYGNATRVFGAVPSSSESKD